MAWRQPENLREWLEVLLRHRKKFFFTCLPAMIIVVVASQWVPREYQAVAMFERINDAALEQMGSSTIERNLRPIRQGLTQDIKGRAALEQLIEDLQLLRDLPHTAEGDLTPEAQAAKYDLIGKLGSQIGIRLRIRSSYQDQVVVSLTDQDRELAPKIVNQLVENYIRNTRQQLDAMLLNAKTFFDREVSRLRARISELDRQKLRFQLDHPGLQPNDPTSVESSLTSMRSQLDSLNEEMRTLQGRRAGLQEWYKDQPEFIEKSLTAQNPEMVAIQEKISELQGHLEAHLHDMNRTEDHPAVIRVRSRITGLQQQVKTIEEEVVISREKIPNRVRHQAEREIESLSGELVAIERQIEDLNKKVAKQDILKRNFFVIRSDYLEIMRELTDARRQLGFWDKNLQNTITALTAEIGQRGVRMRLVERAPDIARPSKPTLAGIMMVAIALGVGAGVLMIILSELLNHSFRSVEQAVDELKLPVMGAINEIIPPNEMFRRKAMAWGLYPAVGVIMMFVLLSATYLAYLSLYNPGFYEQFVNAPGQVITTKVFGDS